MSHGAACHPINASSAAAVITANKNGKKPDFRLWTRSTVLVPAPRRAVRAAGKAAGFPAAIVAHSSYRPSHGLPALAGGASFFQSSGEFDNSGSAHRVFWRRPLRNTFSIAPLRVELMRWGGTGSSATIL